MKKKTHNFTVAASHPESHPNVVSLNIASRFVITLIAVAHLFTACTLIWNRLTKPAFTAGESTAAQFSWQIASGHPPFGPSNIHIQEIWYNPLTFQIAGYFSKLFDYDIRAMRLAMAFFGLGSILLAGMITHHLTRSRWFGFLAACFFIGVDLSPWYVILEPNSTLVFFALLAVYLLVRDTALSWRTIAGVCISLFFSFWSKQTGLAFMVAGVFFILCKDVRKGFAAAAICALITATGMLYYHLQPESSYIQQTFSHGDDPMIWDRFLNPVIYPELLGRFGSLIGILIAAIFISTTRFRDLVRPEYVMLGAATVVGLVTQCKYGSGPTQAILMYGLVISCGLAVLHDLWRRGFLPPSLVLAILSIQGICLIYNPAKYLITNGDVARMRQIIEICATPGKEVYYINQGFYNVLAGKKPYANVGRSCWHNGVYDRSRYPEFFRTFVESDPFDIVIIDVPLEDNSWLMYERLDKNYMAVQQIDPPADAPNRSKLVVFHRKAVNTSTPGKNLPN